MCQQKNTIKPLFLFDLFKSFKLRTVSADTNTVRNTSVDTVKKQRLAEPAPRRCAFFHCANKIGFLTEQRPAAQYLPARAQAFRNWQSRQNHFKLHNLKR
jgi:hypothetical protein